MSHTQPAPGQITNTPLVRFSLDVTLDDVKYIHRIYGAWIQIYVTWGSTYNINVKLGIKRRRKKFYVIHTHAFINSAYYQTISNI